MFPLVDVCMREVHDQRVERVGERERVRERRYATEEKKEQRVCRKVKSKSLSNVLTNLWTNSWTVDSAFCDGTIFCEQQKSPTRSFAGLYHWVCAAS